MALYVYCVIPFESSKEENFSFSHGNKQIYLLPYKGMAAVVANCDKTECKLDENAAIEHEEIIRKVMAEHTVIPMAFGMVFKNQEILHEVLEKSYPILKKHLIAFHNKIEVGIKAISTENAEEDLSSAKEDIENLLGAKSIEAAKGRLFSDRLLLNTSFLIEKNKLEEFSATVAKLEEKYPQLKFLYSGPWPPYSFVNIKIHAG